MKTWNEVMGNPEFAKETPETQQAIRDDYFNKVIRPQVERNGDDVNAVYNDFVSKHKFISTGSQSASNSVQEPTQPNPMDKVFQDGVELSTKPVDVSVPTYLSPSSANAPTPSSLSSEELGKGLENSMHNVEAREKTQFEKRHSEKYKWLRDPFREGYEDLKEAKANHPGVISQSEAMSLPVLEKEYEVALQPWMEQRVVELLENNPEMDYKEAERQARLEQAGEAAELATSAALTVGSFALPGAALATVPRIAALGAAESALTGVAGNAAAERDLDEGIAEDVMLGAVLGAGSKKIVDSVTGLSKLGSRLIGNAAPKDVKELNEVGKKAEEMIQKELDKVGYLTSYFKKKEVVPGVTVGDVLVAKNKADSLVGINEKGAKVGSQTLAEQIDNEVVSKMIMDSRGKMEKLSSASSKNLGKIVTEVVGLRSVGLDKSRKEAIDQVGKEFSNEIKTIKKEALKSAEKNPIKSGVRNMPLKEVEEQLDKSYDPLFKAIEAVRKGDTASSKKFADEALSIIKELRLDNRLRSDVIDTAQKIKTLRKVAEKVPTSSEKEDLIKQIAAPAIGALMGDISGGLAGAALRGGVAKAVTSTSATRLKQVKKALGGKYELDSKAIKMIEDGADIGKIVSYVVMKGMKDEE